MTNVRSDLRIRRHQSTPACARCRRLKQKCDRGTPKCRRCVTAGVDCTAVNRQTSEELPRSLVQYLEQRLSELQHSTSTQSQYDGRTEGTQSGLNAGPDRDQLLAILTLGFTDRITAKMFKSHSVLQHRAKLFYPSERPPYKIPVRGHYYDAHWKGSYYAHSSHFSNFDAHKVPVHVARRLWDNYKDNILPRFPCFREDDLKTYFDEVYGNTNVDRPHPHASGFIVPLILAISSLTSNSHDFQKVVALSESLHLDAMRHDDVLRDSSILALQCMLLLIQLALVLPYIANLWYLTGETMRMAVSLGLHQELDSVMIASDAVHVEQRRRLFWVIYQLDRTVGIAGGCPLALSDEHITTQLPYGGGDSHISKRIGFKQSKSHSYKEKIFLMHTRLRLIQSEIHGIQFFDQPFTSDVENHEDWVQKTTELIQRLVDQMIASGASPSWLVAAAYQCQILLHRPCSRNITVSNSSLLAAVTASTQLLTSYMGSVQDGGLIMTFELANSAFHAGMVLLYALRNHVPNLEQSSLTDKGPNTLEVLCQLLVSSLRPIFNCLLFLDS
ncbi:fungal-specific transcription factor domain-containing protein [Truncatella angustata]|uniref:Fungal-specific transcription factor domain-containing protein n=1 Tax=Truncatella angustata TaxID=152316 RepID=A0A9P8UDJ6_9PEZI|nr:fungal-specific transcription factor domain-containing protein [Truncatella angustata]KAH6647874.1 fungal-specific transcription factor domain-containing protein [Truncatella angustata]